MGLSYCWWETGAWPERAGLRSRRYHFLLSPNTPHFQGSIQLVKIINPGISQIHRCSGFNISTLKCSDLKLFKNCSGPETLCLFFGFDSFRIWLFCPIHVTNWTLSSHEYFTHCPSLHEKLFLLRKAYNSFFTQFSERLEGTHTVH